MKRMWFKILFIVFCIGAGISCKKIKNDKLEATWRLTKVSDIDASTEFELWHFEDGKLTRMLRQDTLMVNDTIDTCQYVLKVSPFRTKLNISKCKYVLYNGEWKVMKLTSVALVILSNRDNLFIYREFEKYE